MSAPIVGAPRSVPRVGVSVLGELEPGWSMLYAYPDGWVEIPYSGDSVVSIQRRGLFAGIALGWLALSFVLSVVSYQPSIPSDVAAVLRPMSMAAVIVGFVALFGLSLWLRRSRIDPNRLPRPLIEVPPGAMAATTAADLHAAAPGSRLTPTSAIMSLRLAKLGDDHTAEVTFTDGSVRTYISPYKKAAKVFGRYVVQP